MKFIFPENFTWGASTASYQIEGAVREDGRGRSVWDVFCDQPGRVNNGDSGETACDHYHRWRDDINLMKKLNLTAYRFSLAWPRIFPNGDGRSNQKGIDFYSRLIDGLLEAGIEPWITLFHWDLPQALQERFGGWKSRETINRFADYAALCGEKFGGRVKNWFTMNEIWCFTYMAHIEDCFAPGGKLPLSEVNQIIHNALIAHGRGVQSLRDTVSNANIGMAENLQAVWPIYETDEYIAAARTAFKDYNSQRLFPFLTGHYDEKAYQRIYGLPPKIQPDDMDIISAPVDFIAYNYYFSHPIIPTDTEPGYRRLPYPEDYPRTNMDWDISPRGLYWSLMFTHSFFPNKPLYITENGIAASDKEERDETVWDLDRIEYYRSHLEMAARAVSDGANLQGYFAWSLMDNFEWAAGYSKRFGLVRVNYRTQLRTIKASGRYYADIIKANRVL